MTEPTPNTCYPEDVETPVGYVDLQRTRANAEKVVSYVRAQGLAWRPHIKTHKSRAIARIQLESGASGLTVATMREAEVMSTLTADILLAYPPVGRSKLDRLVSLPKHVDLKVGLDSVQVMLPLAGAAVAAGREIGVLIEADMGMGRVGLPSTDSVIELAIRASETEGVRFRGVMFYPGHVRMTVDEQDQPLRMVTERVIHLLSGLAREGLEPEIVSGGSTPTLWSSHEVEGLTEVRSGSCIFYDREAVDIGVAGQEDVAYTVLATVVSTAVPGQAVVDAGSKALAKESRGSGDGFGVLVDHPEVRIAGVSEEHGVLDLADSDWTPHIGERVRIVPNHVCVSVNLQDHLLGVEGDVHELLQLEGRGRGPWRS